MIDAAQKYGKDIAFTYNCFPGPVSVGANAIAKINEVGGKAKGQSFLRLQGFIFAFNSRMHPFIVTKSYRNAAHACRERGGDVLEHMRTHAATKAAVLAEATEMYYSGETKGGLAQPLRLFKPFDGLFVYTDSYEPVIGEHDVASSAARAGVSEVEFMYDYLAGGGVLWKPQIGLYPAGNLDPNIAFMQ